MYQAGTEHPWLYRHGFNMMVDFCIWVLEKDGLQIPPFDAHLDGDGMLRKAGFQISEWKSWLAIVVNLQSQQSQVLQQSAGTNRGQIAAPIFLPEVYDPPTAWSGNTSVKEHLYTLWEQYKPLSERRRKWEKPMMKHWREKGINQRLWADLQAYKAHLPSLTIYLVEYPQAVEYLIPPLSSILTFNDSHLDDEDFRHRVLRVAENLSLA